MKNDPSKEMSKESQLDFTVQIYNQKVKKVNLISLLLFCFGKWPVVKVCNDDKKNPKKVFGKLETIWEQILLAYQVVKVFDFMAKKYEIIFLTGPLWLHFSSSGFVERSIETLKRLLLAKLKDGLVRKGKQSLLMGKHIHWSQRTRVF